MKFLEGPPDPKILDFFKCLEIPLEWPTEQKSHIFKECLKKSRNILKYFEENSNQYIFWYIRPPEQISRSLAQPSWIISSEIVKTKVPF